MEEQECVQVILLQSASSFDLVTSVRYTLQRRTVKVKKEEE